MGNGEGEGRGRGGDEEVSHAGRKEGRRDVSRVRALLFQLNVRLFEHEDARRLLFELKQLF